MAVITELLLDTGPVRITAATEAATEAATVTVATVALYMVAPEGECVAAGFMEVEVALMPGAADIDKGLDMKPRKQRRDLMSLVLPIAAHLDTR